MKYPMKLIERYDNIELEVETMKHDDGDDDEITI